jgi:hypothetical protein
MSTISGTVTWQTIVTIVGDSGDGAAVAAYFNGIVVPAVSNTAATATNSSGTVTVTWPNTTVLAADRLVQTTIVNFLKSHTSLTAPITVSVATVAVLAA